MRSTLPVHGQFQPTKSIIWEQLVIISPWIQDSAREWFNSGDLLNSGSSSAKSGRLSGRQSSILQLQFSVLSRQHLSIKSSLFSDVSMKHNNFQLPTCASMEQEGSLASSGVLSSRYGAPSRKQDPDLPESEFVCGQCSGGWATCPHRGECFPPVKASLSQEMGDAKAV